MPIYSKTLADKITSHSCPAGLAREALDQAWITACSEGDQAFGLLTASLIFDLNQRRADAGLEDMPFPHDLASGK